MSQPVWLIERGIGEERAALIDQDQIIATRLRWDEAGPYPGAILRGRITRKSNTGPALAELTEGGTVALNRVPKELTEGAETWLRITRAGYGETGHSAGGLPLARRKLPRAEVVSDAHSKAAAPTLETALRTTSKATEALRPGMADRLGQAGWADLLAEAETGHIGFAGGALIITPTPAMTVIDVDGTLPPRSLALAAAKAIGPALQRLAVSGPVVIDFPTLESRADRKAIAERVLAGLALPAEHSAVNGFGLMQLVMRRDGPSLVEMASARPDRFALGALMRQAQWQPGTAPLTLTVSAAMAALLDQHGWANALAEQTHRRILVNPVPGLDPAAFALS